MKRKSSSRKWYDWCKMMLVLIAVIGAACDLLASELWPARKVLATASLLLDGLLAGGLLAWRLNVFSALLALLCLYRVFNGLRVLEGRMHDRYLRHATRRGSINLIMLQLVVAGLWWAWATWHTTGYATWAVVAGVQLASALVLLASTIRRLQRTRWPQDSPFTAAQAPTLSVLVPARNETDDLQACLQTIIASDYPKLEVLVYDDCSQDKHTPEIIRSFAHDGVRFIQGTEPDPTWLSKNYAYDRLVQAASGQYVLFCGVDMRFAPDTLRKVMGVALAKHKAMVSIVPERLPGARGRFSLVQAMRYWWELVPPRRLFNRPPVLSSCWIIQAKALHDAGGFKAVARSIVPEAYFAKRLIASDGYSFMRAGAALGLGSVKTPVEQRATAVRTRYPQLHKRLEAVFVASLLELGLLALPFVLAIGGWWWSIGELAQIMAAAASVLLIITYQLMAQATRINTWWFGLIALPFVVLTDTALLHYSMWRYEFSSVEWKDRNICIPTMHAIPHLPQFD